ncbi:MAG: hypothetical protein GX577_16650 [Leptolinea sp.]|nr:hypothetical protein [Leptolinea sp.]
MQKSFWIIFCVLMLSLNICGCSSVRMPESIATAQPVFVIPTSGSHTPTPTLEADPCTSIETRKPEIEKIAGIMGEFDDTSYLVQSIPDTNDLVPVILELQRVRREAINNKPPACLKSLKDAQVDFMSGVIITSISMLSSGKARTSEEKDRYTAEVEDRLKRTRLFREAFEKELADQLGLKYITATPAPTLTPTVIPPTSTIAPITATTDQDIYVVQGPGLTYPAVGTFLKGQITNVIGRDVTGEWIQIEVPGSAGSAGWAPKQLIKINGAEASLPVISVEPTSQPTG